MRGFNGRLITCTGGIKRLNPLVLADIGNGSWRLDRLTRSLHPPGRRSTIVRQRWTRRHFATWIQRHMHTRGGREFLAMTTLRNRLRLRRVDAGPVCRRQKRRYQTDCRRRPWTNQRR